ncbi:MAG: PP2C family protein-serine/threonine phosphatase [Candidatus Muiribacteriaceae bacterium]
MNRTHRILIVDDVEINRDFLKTVIASMEGGSEFEIYQAVNGHEAFEALRDIPGISLVILDMMMPEYDGFYFLEKYSDNFEQFEIPIIVMSAAGDNSYIKKAYGFGIYDYFTKPLTMDKFLSFELKLKNALRMKEAMEELDRKTEILENDIRLASSLQYQFLPHIVSEKSYDFTYYYKPYSGLSGDYIDFFTIDEDHVLLILADVAGHGTASAIIATMVKTITGDFIKNHNGFVIEDFVGTMNSELLKLDLEGNLMTAFIALYNQKTRELKYMIAGHPYPILLDMKNRKVEFLESGGYLPLGLFEEGEMEHATVVLEPGTSLVAYTDGILEAKCMDGKFFGLDSMRSFSEDFVENGETFIYYDFVDQLLGKLVSVGDDISMIFLNIKE